MTDIKALLDACPHMAGYRVDDLPPGLGVGVFPQGVVEAKQDILGNVKLTKRYLLRRRGIRGETWVEAMTAWALQQGLKVSGGKFTPPASDGAGIYELTLEA